MERGLFTKKLSQIKTSVTVMVCMTVKDVRTAGRNDDRGTDLRQTRNINTV